MAEFVVRAFAVHGASSSPNKQPNTSNQQHDWPSNGFAQSSGVLQTRAARATQHEQYPWRQKQTEVTPSCHSRVLADCRGVLGITMDLTRRRRKKAQMRTRRLDTSRKV
jgi:hypothetical protein